MNEDQIKSRSNEITEGVMKFTVVFFFYLGIGYIWSQMFLEAAK